MTESKLLDTVMQVMESVDKNLTEMNRKLERLETTTSSIEKQAAQMQEWRDVFWTHTWPAHVERTDNYDIRLRELEKQPFQEVLAKLEKISTKLERLEEAKLSKSDSTALESKVDELEAKMADVEKAKNKLIAIIGTLSVIGQFAVPYLLHHFGVL